MCVVELINRLVDFLDEYGNDEVRFALSRKKGEEFIPIGNVDELQMVYEESEDSDFVCVLLPDTVAVQTKGAGRNGGKD